VTAATPIDPEVFVRRRIAASATFTLLGIAWSASGDSTLGGWLTTLSFAVLVWSLHRLGRTGPS